MSAPAPPGPQSLRRPATRPAHTCVFRILRSAEERFRPSSCSMLCSMPGEQPAADNLPRSPLPRRPHTRDQARNLPWRDSCCLLSGVTQEAEEGAAPRTDAGGAGKGYPGKMCGCVHVHSAVRPQAHSKLCICKCVSVSTYYVLSLVGQAHPVQITKVVYGARGGACHGGGAGGHNHRAPDVTPAFQGRQACAPRSAWGPLRGTRQYQTLL